MKKSFIIVICLSVVLSFSLCACGNENSNENSISDFSDESASPVELGETYEYMGTSIVLPKGFTVSENSMLATPEDYPVHADNIVMSYEKRSKISDIEENSLLELIKSSDKSIFASLEKFDEFKKSSLNGHDVLTVRYKIVYSDVEMSIVQYSVQVSDGIVTYTFTSVTGEYDKAFEASILQIKVSEAE